jgi:hypothetical protein
VEVKLAFVWLDSVKLWLPAVADREYLRVAFILGWGSRKRVILGMVWCEQCDFGNGLVMRDDWHE